MLTTYGAAGLLPPAHPCLVGMPPHVASAGALWDEADVVVAIGSDLDGVQTQNFSMPQPPALIAVNLDPEDAGKNYRVDCLLEGDAVRGTAALAERVDERDGLESLAERLHEVRAQACSELDGRALRFLDAMRFALPDDAIVVADMCIPGYWLAGFYTPAAPRRLQIPLGWGTLGYAFPAAHRRRARRRRAGGRGGRRRRLPVRLRRAGDDGAGAAPVHRGDRGRRRLRDAALRPGRRRRGERYGVDLHTPDFAAVATAFGIRAETVDGLDDEFGEALARHVAERAPSVLVARTPEPLVPPPNTSPNWYRRRR